MRWTFQPFATFAGIEAEWRDLHARSGHRGLLAWEFVAPLEREFATGREHVARCANGGKVSALALLSETRRGVWQTFQPSQAPLGIWLHDRTCPLEPVLEELTRAVPGLALSVSLTQMDPAIVPRPADSPRLATLDYIRTAQVPLVGSFEDYWNARGKNLRQNHRKQLNGLAREGIIAALEVVTAPADIARAVADYCALECAGWKAGQGTAVAAGNAQGRFYGEMLRCFAELGRARIYRYRFNDRVVAIDLCIVSGDELVILKTTYDESIKNFSPATLMRHDYFAQLFAEGRIRRVEFYGRVMDWHTRWTDQVRTLYHINAYRWSLVPRVRDWLARRRPAARAETQADAAQ